MLSSDFAKLSLLTLYLNLSPDRTFRITVKIIGLCFILYAVAYALTSIFSCRPIYASWDLTASATATCIDKEMFYLAASIANVCMDVIILLVPLRIVVPLQIPKRQKVSLLFLFATGGLYVHLQTTSSFRTCSFPWHGPNTVLTSFNVRSVIFVAIYNSTLTVALFNSDNYTWGLAHELSWMYGELAGCVICASASSLRPFFVRYLPSLINSHFGSTGKSLGTSKQHSRGVGGSRLQISRKQPDAYELKSHDDSSSSKEIVQEDDEAHLWLRQGEASCNVTTTLADKVVSRKPSLDVATGRWIYNTARFPDLTSTRNGINVVHTMEVSYSKPARR